jgi:hypothetical protein
MNGERNEEFQFVSFSKLYLTAIGVTGAGAAARYDSGSTK